MKKCGTLIGWWFLALAGVLALAGCGPLADGPPLEDWVDRTLGRLKDRNIPDQAESALATWEAPPSGTFACDLAGVFDEELSEFRLNLRSDGAFDLVPLPEEGIRYQGTWQYAEDKHQIGFHGETQLDYAFYDQGANSLILRLKHQPNEEPWVAFCDRSP
ncbi:MAG: hypothetical protein ACLFWD_02195 [Anaerolineales bacterium]